MTFDFSPQWLERTETTTDYLGAAPSPVTPAPPAPPTCAPGDGERLAALVRELFAEGSLNYEQLRSLSQTPELHGLLAEAVERVPARRRQRGGR